MGNSEAEELYPTEPAWFLHSISSVSNILPLLWLTPFLLTSKELVMSLSLFWRAASWKAPQACRQVSTYVTKMRYLFELKEDDDVCRKAQSSGMFYLFHSLAPLLQMSGNRYLAPPFRASELERLLSKFGQDAQMIEHSVLIGCSDQREAWFALDLGLGNLCSSGCLQKSEMETELQGSFIELRKALFQLNEKDISLIFTAQALLRWHDCHQFCGKSGHPTQKNVAGSKRVCPSSKMIYYPQIHVNSQELESAGWFSLEEVATALRRKGSPSSEQDGALPFWLPPKVAIAHQLIWEWVQKQSSSSNLA
ncbi:nucleoside diphosphate-linked moiety X motif 13 isoform X4 [Vombatus ursinus]|uniref:nucleoside diphosphate-linked moiety X motif 13 isoform X4 n=1 Tax=Vombatus ursinus TaxID=29139 RepID=UPI000FFD46EB|nr:nucleoside diphosphate-linked moiety X motif 13 isoform X4 [Vombatus ursinus]